MKDITQDTETSQPQSPERRGVDVTQSAAVSKAQYRGPRPHRRFSGSDKSLILKSTLKLFSRRLDEDIPVTKADINRLVPYGDSRDRAA